MKKLINLRSLKDYRLFLKIKSLPQYRFYGHVAEFPDEYASFVDCSRATSLPADYQPAEYLFDYQAAVAKFAISKRKFAVFAACGLGKTGIMLDYTRHVADLLPAGRCVLIVSPLMVISQTLAEAQRFYGEGLPIEQVRPKRLQSWLMDADGSRIGITNYEAFSDSEIDAGRLGCLILDESSMLKSMYGKWGQQLIRLGRGIDWKLCLTGTPAPNDRIEYGNHAVFLDHFPTLNSFLARYFVNRGETGKRWELKPHALRSFYRALSHWCIFLENPATYGWKDNVGNVPPICINIHDVPLTDEQKTLVSAAGGGMFGVPAGITSRARLSQLAKGRYNGVEVPTIKGEFIRDLVATWPEESTIIWCVYNHEQEMMERMFPDAASIKGSTPERERQQLVDDFKAGSRRIIISKPKVMGFGLNLQIATRQIFSGLVDSYESFHQAVKRSNRIGSKYPLNVHIPVTDIEWPMVETVLEKARRVQQDTEEQERLFKDSGYLQ